MSVDTQQLQGFDDLIGKLRAMPGVLQKKVLRNALAAGGRLVRDAARQDVPVLGAGSGRGALRYRTPGLLRRALSVRTSRVARQAGDVGVFVNVRPAKGARFTTRTTRLLGLKVRTRVQTRASQRGAKSRVDPFYWRFVEFGTAKMRARSFLRPAARKLGQALDVVRGALGKYFAKVESTGRVDPP